jgi:hypothetical protein
MVAVALICGGLCHAQSTAQPGINRTRLESPQLCMPVSYRHAGAPVTVKGRIGIMGDRYSNVTDVLSGWNQTGIPLIGLLNGQWEPVPCGDDTGLFYLVPLLARQTGLNAEKALDLFLLGILSVSATAGLVGLCLTVSRASQRILSAFPIAASSYVAYRMGDVYVIQAAAVMIGIPWIVYSLKSGRGQTCRAVIAFLLGVFLGLAEWVRTQSAAPILLFLGVSLWFSPLRRSVRLLVCTFVLIGMSLPLLFAQFPLHQRDAFLTRNRRVNEPVSNHHLIWHTAYLGLSYLTNPYVGAWRDSVAADYVQAIDPATIYGGKKYEIILRSRLREIAFKNPKFIFYTLAAKLGALAGMLLVCLNFGLLAAILRPKPLGIELAFWSAMTFAAIPGLFAIPIPQYVLGMITVASLYWFYSVSFYIGGVLNESAASS